MEILERKNRGSKRTAKDERKSNSSKRKCKATARVEDQFGNYLTNEYELLTRTLSFLNLNDLLNASRVSKSWHLATQNILKKREKCNKFRWQFQFSNYDCSIHNSINKTMCRSQFFLGLQLERRKKRSYYNTEKNVVTMKNFEITRNKYPPLIGKFRIPNCMELPFYKSYDSLEYLRKASVERVGIYFPLTNGFKVVATQDPRTVSNINNKELKGILVFTEVEEYSNFETILAKFENSVPIAGGIFFPHNKKQKTGKYFIMFSGEKVGCYSNVLVQKNADDIENFMKKMKNDLGEIDRKEKQRIAFAFQCVGRECTEFESDTYKKYFPDTPAFIFPSVGEYGNRILTKDVIDSSANQYTIDNYLEKQYTSVYFFITINLTEI